MQMQIYKAPRYADFRELMNGMATAYGRRPAFQLRVAEGKYTYISFVELRDRFYALCSAFLRAGLAGKHIAVIGKNRFEWVLAYVAAATVGVAVPLDKELSAADVRDFMNAAGCAAICFDEEAAKKLYPTLGASVQPYFFSEIAAMSQLDHRTDFAAVNALEIPRDAMQILLFTSGTTGNSKGVCLSQYNICSVIYYSMRVIHFAAGDKTLSILPLHHTYESTMNCLYALSSGVCIAYCDGLTKIAKNAAEYQPTVLTVVPALLVALHKRIRASVIAGCPEKYKTLFETEPLAAALAKVPFFVRYAICATVKKSLGGKLHTFILGAAKLDAELALDFNALGFTLYQGYGLTETAPLLACNNDFFYDPESVGVPLPGVTIRIDEPNDEGVGEIVARGDNVMLGYYNDPAATDAVLRDGWFHTGDLGRIDERGAVYICGRSKNVIVTANGKNIYPEELETRLAQFDSIGEALVIEAKRGDDPCVKAKIYPNATALREKLGHVPSADEVQSEVRAVVQTVNAQMPNYKHIKVVEILQEPLEKTTTQKIKRFGDNTK